MFMYAKLGLHDVLTLIDGKVESINYLIGYSMLAYMFLLSNYVHGGVGPYFVI